MCFFPCPVAAPNEQQLANLEERRVCLIRLLENLVAESGSPGVSPETTHTAVAALASVAGRAHAVRRLLEAHSAVLRARQHHLLKPQSTGEPLSRNPAGKEIKLEK